ncbi:MAG: hypothetical protein M0P31_10225 [Solirubrobacteraceae bacterium]|nr:hypothetical protein [Solirubrobacteraceae bacterium]
MTTTTITSRLRRVGVTCLSVGAIALTGCGGSDADTTTNASATNAANQGGPAGQTDEQRQELQACLKQQGVELPELPAGGRGRGDGGTDGDGPGAEGSPPEGAPDGAPPQGGADGGPPPGMPGGGLPGGGLPGGGRPGGPGGGPGGDLSDEDREKLRKAMEACGATRGPGGGRGRGGRPDVSDADYQQRVKAYVACVEKQGVDLPDPDFSGDGPIFDPDEVDQQDEKFRKASAACQGELRPDRGAQSGSDGSDRPDRSSGSEGSGGSDGGSSTTPGSGTTTDADASKT